MVGSRKLIQSWRAAVLCTAFVLAATLAFQIDVAGFRITCVAKGQPPVYWPLVNSELFRTLIIPREYIESKSRKKTGECR